MHRGGRLHAPRHLLRSRGWAPRGTLRLDGGPGSLLSLPRTTAWLAPTRRERWTRIAGAIAVIVVCSLPLWVGLGTADLENDEAIYSYAVDRMVETGDWITPRAIPFDDPFLEKPPLKFWAVSGLMRLGVLPRTETGMRAVDALLGSIVFLYVYLLGLRLGGMACGFGAAAVLVTMAPVLFQHGLRSNNMEAATMAAYCGGVLHFTRWVEGSRRDALAVAGWFVVGFMTKFVAALFLPLVCVAALAWRSGGWTVWRSRWREWVAPTALAVAAIAPWFAWETLRTGRGLWRIMLAEHVYARFTTGLDPHHLQPWSFYVTRTWQELAAAGTSWLALAGIVALGRAAWRERPWLARLVLAWGVIPLVLISGGSSKLFHYAYPFLPAFALGAGLVVSLAWRLVTSSPVVRVAERLPAGPLGSTMIPAALRTPIRNLLAAGALACAGVAVATLVFGPLEWRAEGARVFANSGVVRPLAVAILLAWLSGARALPALTGVVVVASLLPLAAYGAGLRRASDEPHPLRAIRECAAGLPDAPRGPVVFTAVRGLPHPYYYYLRHTGSWRWARATSPAEVRHRAQDPRGRTLLILSQPQYEAAAAGWSALSPVATTGPAAAADPAPAGGPRIVPVSPYPGVVILLPGRYGDCADQVQATGGAAHARQPARRSRIVASIVAARSVPSFAPPPAVSIIEVSPCPSPQIVSSREDDQSSARGGDGVVPPVVRVIRRPVRVPDLAHEVVVAVAVHVADRYIVPARVAFVDDARQEARRSSAGIDPHDASRPEPQGLHRPLAARHLVGILLLAREHVEPTITVEVGHGERVERAGPRHRAGCGGRVGQLRSRPAAAAVLVLDPVDMAAARVAVGVHDVLLPVAVQVGDPAADAGAIGRVGNDEVRPRVARPPSAACSRVPEPRARDHQVEIAVAVDVAGPTGREPAVVGDTRDHRRDGERARRVVPEEPLAVEGDDVGAAVAVDVGRDDVVDLVAAAVGTRASPTRRRAARRACPGSGTRRRRTPGRSSHRRRRRGPRRRDPGTRPARP